MQAKTTQRKQTPGIVTRHSRGCPSRSGGNCGKPCVPAFEAWVYDARASRKLRRTFKTLSAAKAWRGDSAAALRRGTLRASKPVTLNAAAATLLEGARSGAIRRRGGQPFRPSTIRSYETSLNRHVLPELGHRRLGDISHQDLRRLIGKLSQRKLDASTIRNAINPVRVIFREAVADGVLAVDPTARLALPTVEGRRDRIATPDEAERLLGFLPDAERALWACATYAGLRRGELMGLRWADIDFTEGVIHVSRGWDEKEGEIGPKSRAGTRTVPLTVRLIGYLHDHQRITGRTDGLCFGRTATSPFIPSNVRLRALKAWSTAKAEAKERGQELDLEPIGLHECRHTYASLMIAAGVTLKELSEYMGHASIAVTADIYAKLFPGRRAESAAMLDAFLERADTGARLAAFTEST